MANDGNGNLSGFAWSENAGWINFRPQHGGVSIDTITGKFDGYAWGENIGWISFGDDSQKSLSIITSWKHDHDNDGLTSPLEVHVYGTEYDVGDSDADGLDDSSEVDY